MNDTDKKLVEILQKALETHNGPILIQLAELLERRGRSENLFKELMESLLDK